MFWIQVSEIHSELELAGYLLAFTFGTR